MPPAFGFQVTHRDGAARAGVLQTPRGPVPTPAFMPVGTRGAVKGLTASQLREVGTRLLLSNTYHLYLRPGDALVARCGGVHRFIGWDGPILTDSGGFQVFSLAPMRTVLEDGVRFRSHVDGSLHLLTPEAVVDIQARLGSDIAMMLDECPPAGASESVMQGAMARTLRWARRGRARFERVRDGATEIVPTNPEQVQFGIVQGGTCLALRRESAEATVALGFEGYALGGLSVGESAESMYAMIEASAPLLPAARPRYLMGSGLPDDLVEAVARGIDLFDCVLPTRNARNGQLLTRTGRLNIKNARFAADDRPPDPECTCYTCRHVSRAYLRHLHLAQEMTGATLNTLHNLHFYLDTMRRIREAIVFGSFESFRQDFHRTFSRHTLLR